MRSVQMFLPPSQIMTDGMPTRSASAAALNRRALGERPEGPGVSGPGRTRATVPRRPGPPAARSRADAVAAPRGPDRPVVAPRDAIGPDVLATEPDHDRRNADQKRECGGAEQTRPGRAAGGPGRQRAGANSGHGTQTPGPSGRS